MGRQVEFPKRHIVSCRVDNNELLTLKKLARKTGTNISDLLRNCLDQLAREGSDPRAGA